MKSRAYFLARCPKARYEQLIALNSDLSWKKQQYIRIRKQSVRFATLAILLLMKYRLGVLEIALKERRDNGEGPFLAGLRPTHADFCVFA